MPKPGTPQRPLPWEPSGPGAPQRPIKPAGRPGTPQRPWNRPFPGPSAQPLAYDPSDRTNPDPRRADVPNPTQVPWSPPFGPGGPWEQTGQTRPPSGPGASQVPVAKPPLIPATPAPASPTTPTTSPATTKPKQSAWPDDIFTPLTTPELNYQSPDYNLPDAQFNGLPELADQRQQREQQETFDYDPLTQQVGDGQISQLKEQLFGSRDNSQLPDFHQRGETSDFYQRNDPSQLPNIQRFLDQAGTEQGSRDEVEQATYDRMYRHVEPQFQQQREQLTQNLVNRGIPIGSQAYDDAMNRMEQEQNRARENFALTATREGGAEQSRLYQLLSSGRQQLFGEGSRMSDEASRQRAQMFGEGTQQTAEAAQQRAQLFGEETQGRAEQLAGRQQWVNEGSDNFQRQLQSQGFNRDTQQGNFENLANMFNMERGARQDYFNEGNILSDEAANRRAQMYGEQQGQWNRETQGVDAQRGIEQQAFGNQRQLAQEAMQRRQQGISEYLTSRNQPISELQALMGIQRPPQQPQFPGTTQYGVDAPNLQGLVGQQYGQQTQAHNQQQGNMWGGLTGLASLFI